MPRWRYLRWWLAALVASALSFLALWLPMLFRPQGAAGCTGYGPLPFGLAEVWSELERMWLHLREPVASSFEGSLLLNGLPTLSVLLATVVSAWAGRRLAVVVGVLAALVVAVVALDWAFMVVSYFMMLGCAGWEGRLPWLVWQLLPMFGYGSAVVMLVAGMRVRRRAERVL
ncbi:hypothetical protein ACQP2T_07580 [Nonomuraea sp. CA-143628]|uniref:hypothetical protein n=1 Tax=Nonomuraea sp. CA-143628 TaxID=3239997 RepID=UPI003D8B2E57